MKALVIGAAGFVGGYLLNEITNKGWEAIATKLPGETLHTAATVYNLDLLDEAAVTALLQEIQPDYIFHLAAQSSVALSWKNPALTVDVNIKGSLNLLESLRGCQKQPRVLLIGSGEEYGRILPEESPIGEATLLRPGNIYAATKACQGMLGKIYADAYGLDIILVRAFNHFGPGQSPLFVISDFCKQVAAIEAGRQPPVIRVGNLAARRDFTDVRDVVEGYCRLIQDGNSGETYNVGSGKAIAISELLEQLLKLASVPISVEVDESRLRPVDIPVIEADITKLQQHTGWQPHHSVMDTLADTLDYWRKN